LAKHSISREKKLLLLLILFIHSCLVGKMVLAEAVSAMLEREMVRHDRMKSMGRVVEVVVSEMGLKIVNINRQPAHRKFHNLL
jgi:hypothetical protein